MLDSILLQIAKNSILSRFDKNYTINEKKLVSKYSFLAKDGATFVTLHKNGALRGCIGSIVARRSLLDDIVSNAASAAFRDPRFSPLEIDELSELTLEVSLLSQPELIEYKDYEDLCTKIEPAKDGLILKHTYFQGTFLPQVWEELPTTDLFLQHLSQKAGATPAIYKEHPMLYKYRVEAIEEDFDAILPLEG
jgi:AmmeMemoRadiSam system protein A